MGRITIVQCGGGFTHSSRHCAGDVTGSCEPSQMLHSVRYLQSQWNARSPELSLKDLVDLMRPSASLALIERARRHYQACRIQCFLRGVAVAVDGPMPTSGGLLLGTASDPDFAVGSVRPSLTLNAADLAAELPSQAELSRQLAAQVLGALQAGLLVYVRPAPLQTRTIERLRELAKQHRYPVLTVTLQAGVEREPSHPLALREVVVRVTPDSGAAGAHTPAVH